MVFHVGSEKKYRNKKNLTHDSLTMLSKSFRQTDYWDSEAWCNQCFFFFIILTYLKGTAIVIQLHIEKATVYQHFELKLRLTVQEQRNAVVSESLED